MIGMLSHVSCTNRRDGEVESDITKGNVQVVAVHDLCKLERPIIITLSINNP